MKSLKSRLRRQDAPGPVSPGAVAAGAHTADWNKYDDRLMKAAERGDVEKVSAILARKGVNPAKLDVEGRSAFHVVASKGNLECLNAILIHGIDITTSDTAGRNALHLAAKYGHVLCLQKLLQYNCPTEHVDLQGRTALHDAAMADCPSSIQLLCDHGASVNAKDIDGRTPLVLATQMCRPAICQLLIDRGANVNSRDKQNRTALMLGCEYGCKDAVDVLIKNGADISLLDALGHDSAYYARIGDNLDILTLLKTASENTHKGREHWKKGPPVQQRNLTLLQGEVNATSNQRQHRNIQDLEIENEDLKERLRKIQQEQRILVDKVNGLQLQLNESDHLGPGSHFSNRKEDILLKQGQIYMTDSQCPPSGMAAHVQSRSMLRPLELSSPNQSSYSENEILKKELEAMRTFCDSAKQDRLKLQNELAHKVAECKALALECERVKEDSDEQIKQLEDALKDVQKRMYESEGKVKQMQTHFLALKEHFTNEAAPGSLRLTEELKEQLKDMKAKYEGAAAEVGTLRNQIQQNEMLVEERRRGESKLIEENKRLQKNMSLCEMDREKKGRKVLEMERQLKELSAELALSIPKEKFESMKSLLSGEVNEKAKKLVETQRDYEKSVSEIKQLKRELDDAKAKLALRISPEEHEQLKSSLEQKSGELGKKLTEFTVKNETLQKEMEKVCVDNKLLNQQVHNLTMEIKTHYVPLTVNQELKKSHDVDIEDLNRKLLDVTQKYTEKKLAAEKLQLENDSLRENVSHLEAVYVPPEQHEKELMALKSSIAELQKELSELHKKCDEGQEKIRALLSENTHLKKTLSTQYVPAKTHEEMKMALSNTLDKTKRELLDVKKKMEQSNQEVFKMRDENEVLKRNLENTQNHIKAEYIRLEEHEAQVSALRESVRKAQADRAEMMADYGKGQEEIATLHAEIQAQKKELDTIQECIQLKYAPIVSFEECERKFKATEKELKEQLSEQTRKSRIEEEETRKTKEENDKLKKEILALQKDLQNKGILIENSQEKERAFSQKADELSKQVSDLSQKYAEVKKENEQLVETSAKQTSEMLAVHSLLQKQHIPVEQVEALKSSLNGTIEHLEQELKKKKKCLEEEQQTVATLHQLLENQKNSSVALTEHLQVKGTLEEEVGLIRARLREKEEESQSRTEEVSKLQTEVQRARQVIKQLEAREVVDLSKYNTMKRDLEAQISNLNQQLASLNRKYEEVCEERLRGKKELSPKEQKESVHFNIEQELQDQKERCDRSLTTVTELQRRIQESAKQLEAKDDKITELLTDVERLKQALNGLSQLTYASGSPTKRQSQLIDSLQHQVKSLRQQLADANRQHQEVIAIYRTHLLSAAQGHMDEDVQAALLQIIQMRQGLVC
ncbi:uveal autoantigen with coiled-coil domains and ankyrin repeats isoform X3 [Ochotona princeps]|uniref:uveal autoantigen with coiled-coil domains and ankyrin repeats isoform X3 n=1 Tax=Ochotona princeps TaxID=9978 RepID=UPI002714838A|nr:uveal autoantigen with coiled-coil domains and ankyrin repeats isoform X3 [Ochotona princeps]